MISDIDWEARGESVLHPMGALARAIDAMPFDDFFRFMIELGKQHNNTTTRKVEDNMRYIHVTEGAIRADDEHMLKADLINGANAWTKTSTSSIGRQLSAYPEYIFRRSEIKPLHMAFLIRSNNVMVYPGQKIVIGCETVEDHKMQAKITAKHKKNEIVSNETPKTTIKSS
jgi:hypothetical protein